MEEGELAWRGEGGRGVAFLPGCPLPRSHEVTSVGQQAGEDGGGGMEEGVVGLCWLGSSVASPMRLCRPCSGPGRMVARRRELRQGLTHSLAKARRRQQLLLLVPPYLASSPVQVPAGCVVQTGWLVLKG